MKKEWKNPELNVLTIGMTMAGPGLAIPDAVQEEHHGDPDELLHHS